MTEVLLAEREILREEIHERDAEIYELQRQIEVLKKKLNKAESELSYLKNSMCGNMEMGK